MSTTTTPSTPTTPRSTTEPPPVPIRLRRTGAVVAMLLAPWCWVVANTAYMVAIRDGGSDIDGAGALALSAEHPTTMRVVLLAVMLGGILVVPAVMGLFRLAPISRLVTVGGAMMVAGYICYAGVAASGFTTVAMAEVVGPTAQLADVIDTAQADPWLIWAFIAFVLGNLVGTLVLVAGLVRSRAVARWAALAIGAWPVLHVIGLTAFHNEVPQVLGALAQAVGFAGCAITLHRRDALALRRA
jgi:hypothetical protein